MLSRTKMLKHCVLLLQRIYLPFVRAKVVYQYLYRRINDKKVMETVDFRLNREEAHNALFREEFNKVRDTGSNKDFGVTADSRIYFDLSHPSPDNSFGDTKAEPTVFNNPNP